MDVLNPGYAWIENRCYRVLPIKKDENKVGDNCEPCINYSIDEDDAYDTELLINHQGDRFYTIIYVPEALVGYVVGRNSKMKIALEKYGATINIPKRTNSDVANAITITASSKKIVADTFRRIEDIVNTNRLREDFTHFVSIPINSLEIQNSYLEFKKKVLTECKKIRGVDESIFQNPSKLHLTITPLVLLDERDRQKAEAILMNCKEKILKDFGEKEFVLYVKGIEYMNDDPSDVDVLYAKLQEVEDDNILQLIADDIMKAFVDVNFSKKSYDSVKLHITLMNTRYRDNVTEERITFDAEPILKEFGDYEFGKITVSEIHISVRYTAANDGYYIPCCKIKLNA